MTDAENGVRRSIAILAYHKIGPPPSDGWDTWHYIPEAVFRSHLQWIAQSGWTVLTLRTFLAGLDAPWLLPQRSILLTFDDGHRSMHDLALPHLKDAACPAVCFVPSRFVGRDSSFDRAAEPIEPMCGWDELRELVRNGVEVQSHGASHTWLSLLSRDELARELTESKQVLEAELNRQVSTLAYPFSDCGTDPAITRVALQAAGYRCAFLCGGGPSRAHLPVADVFRIDRLAVYRDTDLDAELSDSQYVRTGRSPPRQARDARGG